MIYTGSKGGDSVPLPKPIPLQFLRMAAENRRIAAENGYRTLDGRWVSLPCNAAACAARTQLLDPALPAPHPRTQPFQWEAHHTAQDTVSCILSLRKAGITGEILALNFANANIPGGGYLLGGNAQEESLCRASLLYAVLAQQHTFYRYHHLHPSPLYSDRMLYSPDVPLFRSAAGELLPTPQHCSFLTCAAVNRRLARPLYSEQRILAAMQTRTAKIIAAAAEIQPAVLILGAFGCGAFGNRQAVVLPMFSDAISKFLPESVQVMFAIPR